MTTETAEVIDLGARLVLLDQLQQRTPSSTAVGESELARWASQQLGRPFSDADIEAALHPPATGLAELPPIRATILEDAEAASEASAPSAPGLGQRVLQTLQWGHALPLMGVGLVSGAVLPAMVGVPVLVGTTLIGCYGWTASLGQRWLATVEPGHRLRQLTSFALPRQVFQRHFPWGKRWRKAPPAA